MQRVSGNIGQSLRHDYGDFIEIGDIRCRKELVTAYFKCQISDDPKGRTHGVKVLIDHGWIAIGIGDDSEASQTVEKLDWQYKKDARE